MSLAILAQGTLVADPRQRTSSSGKTYVTGSMRAATDDGSILVSLIAFGSEAQTSLLALNKGDELAVCGRAKLSSWTGKDGTEQHGLSVTVERVMTLYAVRTKREKVAETNPPKAAPSTFSEPAQYGPAGGFDGMRDYIPWASQP